MAGTPVVDEKRPRLTNAFIKSIDRPTRRGDGLGGNGLSIIAYTNAAGELNKAWSQRIVVDGKDRTFGLGKWPQITPATARKRAFENVSKRDNGKDIRETKRNIPTMGEAFDQFIADHTPEWKRRGERRAEGLAYKWELSKRYCKSILSKKISAVTHDDVKDLLRHDWHERAPTAAYVQNHLSQIFDQAVQMEIRTSDPANRRYLVRAFGKQPKSEHHRKAPYEDLGSYLAKIRDSDSWWAAKYCLIFIALTEDRSGEVRLAVWDDVDWDKETLTIPEDRMKGDKAHVIPLPKQAMEILRFAWSKPRHSKGTIFPPQRGGRFLPKGAMLNITKKLDLPFVPHGLRGSFADWASDHENDGYKELAKLSLAHVVDNQSDQAYFTKDPIHKRRAVLQEYANYLTKTMGPVISPMDQDQDTDDMAGLEKSVINAVPGSDQQAGKPENGTTAATAGRTTKRHHPAPTLATVNRRTHKDKKQRIQDLQKPLLLPLLPTKTRT